MLKIRGLESCYGESCIVSGLTLDVPKGEIVGLIGRNGVGKSTTLKSIMGLVKTPHGAIEQDGEDIIRRPTYERAAAGLGYVPQGRDIFPQMTVQENLELALYAQKKHGKVPDYIYDLFPILPKFAARRGGDLSGGQQQQLAIARALVADPKVRILDEPTEGIQPSVIADIGTAIQRINKELGLTVLLVEPYLDFVLENTTQLYVMEKGALIYSSATVEADGAYIQRLMTA
ncbi:urea ABC transporter ATP-binding subunit UrtE [Butyricicoccus sp.]